MHGVHPLLFTHNPRNIQKLSHNSVIFHVHIGKDTTLKGSTNIFPFLPGVSINGWMNGCLHEAHELTFYCMHYNLQNFYKTWLMCLPNNSFNICPMSHAMPGAGNSFWNCLKSQGATNFQNRLKHLPWRIDLVKNATQKKIRLEKI